MKLNDMPYARPDMDAFLAQLETYAQEAAAADSKDALLAVFLAQDKTMAHYTTMSRLATIHYTVNTRDAYWAAERAFYDETLPRVGNGQMKLAAALLANPYVGILEEKFGETILPRLKNDVMAADERLLELQKEENALVSAYEKVYGGAMVEFQGQEMTIPQVAAFKEDPDASVRFAAYAAEGSYFDEHRAEFDDIYSKLIICRNKQAKMLGYETYRDLSYIRLNRIGYAGKEMDNYRKQVLEQVVPLAAKIHAVRMKRASIATPHFADSLVAFADGNPLPKGTPEDLVAAAVKMFREMSPETAEFFDYVDKYDLHDLPSRPGKMSGGYQSTILEYTSPFIFCNFNGTSSDVKVLIHEAGHGFEAYLATRNPEVPICLQAPGLESCEIHSMGMEFLTAPWHHLFFGEDTQKYQLLHAEEALFFLPYGCMVDEFQKIVYEQPELTPDERNEVWLSLEAKYRPWNDLSGLPFYGRGAGWQRQLHIYEYPFYYLDYCLAQTVALQFFAAHLEDHDDAWKRFLALDYRAGRDTYETLVRGAGFLVPFEDGSLQSVTETIGQWIMDNQP